MKKCILSILQSPHIGYATLSQNALGIHDDTASNGFSSEVIWISCNHRNKKLKQLSLPTNSKLNSFFVYRCYVKQLRVYSNSFRHANFVIHLFLPPCYCVEQGLQPTARGPSPSREAISFGPQSHFAHKEK